MEQLQQILDLQSQSLAELPHRIPFIIDDHSMLPEGFPAEMRKYREDLPEKLMTDLIVAPAKVGTFFRIYNLIAKIDKDDLDKLATKEGQSFHPEVMEVQAKYMDTLIEIICVGLHNKKGEYPSYMPDFLKANCDWRELNIILNSILARLGFQAFIDSTTQLMRVGPGAEEIIALQENLESWVKK